MTDNRNVFFIIGWLLAALAAGMLIPALVDFIYQQGHALAFVTSAVLTGFAAGGLIFADRGQGRLPTLSIKQAFLLTNLTWISLTLFAALPFIIAPPQLGFSDAIFESISGLSTTGATILTGLDEMNKGILIWRAILQWFGGIGIIVMAVAILPMLNIGGMQLFRMESSDNSEKILPHAQQIAGAITRLYIYISCACAFAYWLAGMNMFDAIAHAMTTIATGGFSTHDASFAFFNHAGINSIATFFMLLSSLPFVVYLQMLNGRPQVFWQDMQIRGFLTIATAAFLCLVIYLYIIVDNQTIPIDEMAFNIISILTGTGFAASDYGQWGAGAISIFFIITFLGGCAGSTSCGLKTFRLQVLARSIWRNIGQLSMPHGVFSIRYNGRLLEESVIHSVTIFALIFFLSFFVIAVFLSLLGLDMLTALSASAAAIANVGPGLGEIIGPTGNYASLPELAKWVLCFGMLLGRLEFMTILVMILPQFWRR